MKRFTLSLLLTLFLCAAAFGQAQKNVAVLELNRHPEIAAEVSHREALEITNVIRGAAVRTLPHGQFNVMTSETVQSMGGAVLAECFDETCVIQLGRTIDAEYVMRGSLSKFQTMFTLNIEMFETEYGNLVATSASVRSENLMDILNISEFATVEMLETFIERHAPQTARTRPTQMTTNFTGTVEDFTIGQRLATFGLNIILPGGGHAIIMEDWTGAIVVWATIVGTTAIGTVGTLLMDESNVVYAAAGTPIGAHIFFTGTIWNTIRTFTYNRPGSPRSKKPARAESIFSRDAFNFALFPDRDGNWQASLLYMAEF